MVKGNESGSPLHAGQELNIHKSGLTFILVPGSWHRPDHMRYFAASLEAAGHAAKAVDVPIDEPDATFEDYTDTVCREIDDEENTAVVLHSRMGNLGPRIAANLAVKHMIYICAGFETNNKNDARRLLGRRMPPKYSADFIAGIRTYKNDKRLTVYDPDSALDIFFHDCSPQIAEWAVSIMRPQYRPVEQAPIKVWPEVPTTFLRAREDRVYNPAYTKFIARHLLRVKATSIDGGHEPFIAKPDGLVETVEENLAAA